MAAIVLIKKLCDASLVVQKIIKFLLVDNMSEWNFSPRNWLTCQLLQNLTSDFRHLNKDASAHLFFQTGMIGLIFEDEEV